MLFTCFVLHHDVGNSYQDSRFIFGSLLVDLKNGLGYRPKQHKHYMTDEHVAPQVALKVLYNTVYTFRFDCQGLTLIPLKTPTDDTIYCYVVIIASCKTSHFMLCDIGSVQKSLVWGLGSVGDDVDKVGISITPCPAQSNIHSSIDIFRDINRDNTGEGGYRWRS